MILRTEDQAQVAITHAKGEAEVINMVSTSIHEGKPTSDLSSY